MKKKFKKNTQKNFQPKIKKISVEDVSNMNKERIEIVGKINRIIQTGGPTIFILTDGTGLLPLKGFEGAGVRSYPEINEGDVVKVFAQLEEYQGGIEGEIINIYKVSKKENDGFLEKLEEIEKQRAKVNVPNFLVKNKILDKLKDSFVRAAEQIRLAIIQDRPIIVRHHNDTDGYSSGFALERAILPLIEKQHGAEKAGWEFFTRAPCVAPFYEIDDSIRDTANSLRNVAKFSNKMPLIIIVDNGSSPEDLMAIKQGKVHGSDFIVIDHHYFEKDVISKEVLVHINPFLVGESGSSYSAGMLCSELARFINMGVENISQIPAMAGYADKIDLENPEVMKKYLEIARKEGYTKELLYDIALVIDYVSTKVKFMEVREYIEVLFGQPRNKQKELVSLMAPYIKELDKKGLAIANANSVQEKIGKVVLQSLDIEASFPRFGFFPKPGRTVGLVHDNYQEKENCKSLITIGILNTAITIRATNEADFSIHDLIGFLNKKLPNAFVEGGGHKNAGSITFLPNKKEEVVQYLKEFIKN